VYCGVRWIREKVPTRAAGFIVIGFLTSYALYVPLSLRRSVWISYFLPAIPFLCLALGAVLDDLVRFRWSRTVAVVYAGAALALFAFFYPTLTAKPLSPYQRELRIWFDDCDSPGWHIRFDPTGPIGPQKRILDSGAPPNGWCWGETRPI
jgi:dolichyl-phosphate-mannose--protein O-mannosyl transferase